MLFALTLFVALFVATFLLMLGSGLLGSLVGLRMSLEGFAPAVIGQVMAGFYLGLVLGSFVCPNIVRRAGHSRAFAAFAAVTTATTLLFPLFVSPQVWFLFRVLSGFSMMGLYMILESWLAERTEPDMRGRVFSIYMAMTFLGLSFGQLFLNTRDLGGSDLFLVAGIFFSLCLVPVSLTRSINPELPEIVTLKLRDLSRRAPLGLLGSLFTGAVASAFFSLAPVFALESGLAVDMVAWFMGATIFCGLLLQWPVGLLSDRFDRRLVLGILNLLVTVASLGIIVAAERSLLSLFIATACYGGLAFTLYPVAVAHTNDRIHNYEIIGASTALILCYGVGACLGPVAAAWVMHHLGPSGLYGFIGGVTGFFGFVALAFRRSERPVAEEPVPYVPVPRTSSVISSLHPHSETEEEWLDHQEPHSTEPPA